MEISEDYIIKEFITSKNKVNPNKCNLKWLDKHSSIKEFLESKRSYNSQTYGDIVSIIAYENGIVLKDQKHQLDRERQMNKDSSIGFILEEPEYYTDELIKDLIAIKNHKGHIIFDSTQISSSRLKRKPKLKAYLETRFQDTRSLKETLYRIFYGYEEIPKCKMCGNPASFCGRHHKHYHTYCSEECKRNDKDILYSTRQEDVCYQILCDKFGPEDVIRQYQDPRYKRSDWHLYLCDFYIKSLDLFIELNGYWTHWRHPFDPSNVKDLERLETLRSKSSTSRTYQNAIKVWTIDDPEKIRIAKDNNLNYLVVYDFELAIKEFKEALDNKYHCYNCICLR